MRLNGLQHNRHTMQFWQLDFSLKSKDAIGKIAELYCILLLSGYPMFLMQGEIGTFQIKTILYYFLTIGTMGICLVLAKEKKIKLHSPKTFGEYGILAFGIWNGLIIILKLLKGDAVYEKNLLYITFIISLFLVAGCFTFYEYYFNLLLFSGAAVFVGLLLYYLGNIDFVTPIEILITNQQWEASFILLILALGILKYCSGKHKGYSVFLLTLISCGYLLLFLNGHTVGIVLIAAIMLIIPLIFRPTAELVKRLIILFFLYFFILSNLGLIVKYTNIFKKIIAFDSRNSICLELLLMAAGIIFFAYWEKVTQNKEINELDLPYVQKIFKYLLVSLGIFMGVVIFGGDKFISMRQHAKLPIINSLIYSIRTFYQTENGSFFDILQEFGVVTFLIIIMIWLRTVKLIAYKKESDDNKKILTIMSILFLIQLLFFSVNLISTPIYIVLLAFGVYERKEGTNDNLTEAF